MKSKTKAVKTEVVSKEQQLAEKNTVRQEMVDLLTERIEKKQKELETKKYIVEGGEDTAKAVLNFLNYDAQWKFTEALGVIEATRQIEESAKAITTNKTKELLVNALALEAIYYFLTKVERKGLSDAKSFVNGLLKPISDALGRIKQDREGLDQMIRDRGTLESAIDSQIDIENEDNILKEIQEELLTSI
jgi:hypothetical protein